MSDQQSDEILKLLRHLVQAVARQKALLESTVNFLVEVGNVNPLDLGEMQQGELEKLRPFLEFVSGADAETLLRACQTPPASPKAPQPGLQIVPKKHPEE